MRLFAALEIPVGVRQGCSAFQRELAASGEVTAENESDLHMTVAFLGERPPEDLEAIGRAIAEAATSVSPESVVLSGPVEYRELDRVAMLVFEDDGGQTLWRELNARLADAIGYKPQFPKAWLPHITIVRFPKPPNLNPPLPPLPSFSPRALKLYETVPRSDGPRYSVIGSTSRE